MRSFSRTVHLATPETNKAADSCTNNWFVESKFGFHPDWRVTRTSIAFPAHARYFQGKSA
jgi:hypothetical protein